jgi:hypothetical protein
MHSGWASRPTGARLFNALFCGGGEPERRLWSISRKPFHRNPRRISAKFKGKPTFPVEREAYYTHAAKQLAQRLF